jgi:hypothetical protein
LLSIGGTILSISDQVAVLPLGGMTALQAQGIRSRITAENPSILALGLGQTGISCARAVDGGLVTLDGGKIEIVSDNSFGLFGDNGTVNAKGALTISMTGIDSHGIEARGIGSVEIDPTPSPPEVVTLTPFPLMLPAFKAKRLERFYSRIRPSRPRVSALTGCLCPELEAIFPLPTATS